MTSGSVTSNEKDIQKYMDILITNDTETLTKCLTRKEGLAPNYDILSNNQ